MELLETDKEPLKGEGNGKLSLDTFHQLRDLIYEKSGIYFADAKKYLLENRLVKRLEEKNFKTFEEYYYFLKYDPRRHHELSSLFDSITTNETSFFRNPPQLEAFEKGVMPVVVESHRKSSNNKIRIWSAACSTGEEPYTIAIILLENKLLVSGMSVEIVASDISEIVLASARKGVYGSNSIRNTSKQYLDKYFAANSDSYAVKPEVKNMVKFNNINLYDQGKMKMMKGFDVIFCRNVLIYFDEKAKRQVISNLYDSLNICGYLIIGHSESLHNISRAFKLININRMPVYKKE
ncbi:MAG: protein-glutamate O-methyltransferase CheR [Nitrospinae bacterium]|nr:protein-glutamate O-methyltransferase CheR [Nitrospinota bacterium]